MLLNEIQKDILCMRACYLLEDRLIKLFELPMSDINFYKYCLTPPPPGAGGIYILLLFYAHTVTLFKKSKKKSAHTFFFRPVAHTVRPNRIK